jgi:hypothetical protein
MFKKRNPSDAIDAFTLDFFIKNAETYNFIEEKELDL